MKTLPETLTHLSLRIGRLVTAIGAIVLVGWAGDLEILKSILPGLVTMKANTASGFILAGSSLILWHRQAGADRRGKWAARGSGLLAGSVLALGLLTSCQYLFGVNLGIDELLFSDIADAVQTSQPGRMAPNTAANFLLTGAALLLLHRRRYGGAQLLMLAVTFVSWLGFLGYLYGIQTLYAPATSHTAMALHTSLAFILAGLGILFARPDCGWMAEIVSPDVGGVVARRILPFIVILPSLLGGLSTLLYRAHLLRPEIEFVLRATFNLLILGGVTWWNAGFLNRLDRRHRSATRALRESREELEMRVGERTAELAESRRYLSTLIDTLPGIVFARDPGAGGAIAYLSDGCEGMTGYGADELTESEKWTYDGLIDPRDRRRVFDGVRDVISQGEPAADGCGDSYEVKYRIRHRNGGERWFWEKGRVARETRAVARIEGFITDITAERRAEIALEDSRARLRAIIDAEPECVKLVSPQGILLDMNRGGLEMAEVDRAEDAIGQSVYPLIAPPYREKFRQFHRQICAGNRGVLEYEIVGRRGTRRWMETHAVPLQIPGERTTVHLSVTRDISDRRQMEMALRDGEEKFRLLTENIREVFFIHTADLAEILYVSPAYETIFGVSCESLYENPRSWRDVVHPDDRDRVSESLEAQKRGGEFRQEYRIVRPDGAVRWIRSRSFPVYSGGGELLRHVGIAEDISDGKEAEIRRRRAEERYRCLVSATAQVIWTTDAEGRMVEPQASWEAHTGQGREEYWDWGWREAVHPEDRDRVTRVWTEALENCDTYQNECRIRGRDGDYRYFWVRGVPVIEDDGSIREWVGACTDITERQRAEREIRQLNNELEYRVRERTAELMAINEELEAFSYSVSHDLRSPLRAVSGFSQVLLERYEGRLDDRGVHYLRRIQAAAGRMGELIDDLLSLSRVTRTQLRRTPFDLSEIAREIVADLREAEPERPVEWAIAPDIFAYGDRRLLRIVLENLLNNAWKFSRFRNPARIELNAVPINRGDEMIYFVRDNGVGFDPALADRLFCAFGRLHRAEEFPGTGIGLATTQRIVHRHGGRVWAIGEPEAGAIFYFSLPLPAGADSEMS